MRRGQTATQAPLGRPDELLYFTGEIIDTPDTELGLVDENFTVRVDGDVEKLRRTGRAVCMGDLLRQSRGGPRRSAVQGYQADR